MTATCTGRLNCAADEHVHGCYAEDARRGPSESEYRQALYAAQRALLHAKKWLIGEASINELLSEALVEVNRVLDVGRDGVDEMVAT